MRSVNANAAVVALFMPKIIEVTARRLKHWLASFKVDPSIPLSDFYQRKRLVSRFASEADLLDLEKLHEKRLRLEQQRADSQRRQKLRQQKMCERQKKNSGSNTGVEITGPSLPVDPSVGPRDREMRFVWTGMRLTPYICIRPASKPPVVDPSQKKSCLTNAALSNTDFDSYERTRTILRTVCISMAAGGMLGAGIGGLLGLVVGLTVGLLIGVKLGMTIAAADEAENVKKTTLKSTKSTVSSAPNALFSQKTSAVTSASSSASPRFRPRGHAPEALLLRHQYCR